MCAFTHDMDVHSCSLKELHGSVGAQVTDQTDIRDVLAEVADLGNAAVQAAGLGMDEDPYANLSSAGTSAPSTGFR